MFSPIKERREGGYQIPVPSLNVAQIPVPRLIFAKIPVTKSKIPLLMISLQNHAHNQLKALIDAIWIHVPSPGLKKIFHIAGEWSIKPRFAAECSTPQLFTTVFFQFLWTTV